MLPHRIRTDGFVEPCIPTRAAKAPVGPDWVHEFKHDGYRLIARRDGATVRLFISYDEKPGIQAIATTAPDLPPEPGVYATFAREHEYKRHGTVSLLAGIAYPPWV